MITSGIINVFYWFIATMIGWLPSATSLPDGINTALTFIGNFMSMMIDIIPALDIVPVAIGIILTFELALFIWDTTDWIINKVRGSGS